LATWSWILTRKCNLKYYTWCTYIVIQPQSYHTRQISIAYSGLKQMWMHCMYCNIIKLLHATYYLFTIVSNSDCLWKSDISVGNVVIWHNKSILGYNWITLNQLGNWQQDEYLITKRHMTGPDANLTKNIVASCMFKTIVNDIYTTTL
jgi:hypothetical protein